MMLSGSAQFLIEPAIPRSGELLFKSQAVVFFEIRIDSALQRMKPQQVCSETVEGADLGLFNVVECRLSPCGNRVDAQPITCLKVAARDSPPIARLHRI